MLVHHAPYPTLETVHRFAHDEESQRAFARQSTPHPVQVISLQETPFGTMFSDALQDGMEQALQQGGGIVIYHNRKGFSSSITCRDCGTAPQCPRCRIPLGLRQSQLRCSYCGQAEPIPSACPVCSGIRLEPVGFGTERLEEELHRLYPNAVIARYDGNTIRSEAAAARIREQFSRGRTHVVVGTELLFQASPFTPVRCVGIPYADAGLHVPDFRSSERVFHHLQQAVDLLTPGLLGSAIIQTRLPSHPAMHAIGQQQPDLFYDHELAFRRLVGYPPFGQLIQLHVSGEDATETEKHRKDMALASHGTTCQHDRARRDATGRTKRHPGSPCHVWVPASEALPLSTVGQSRRRDRRANPRSTDARVDEPRTNPSTPEIQCERGPY